ncbi:hypothetical protein K438DRAFT_1937672 [Mycena galopus ATCC 62051]|nr:hypothetical protein K438DRAFT_1937672 [Mycena galopus ATCC 62051]
MLGNMVTPSNLAKNMWKKQAVEKVIFWGEPVYSLRNGRIVNSSEGVRSSRTELVEKTQTLGNFVRTMATNFPLGRECTVNVCTLGKGRTPGLAKGMRSPRGESANRGVYILWGGPWDSPTRHGCWSPMNRGRRSKNVSIRICGDFVVRFLTVNRTDGCRPPSMVHERTCGAILGEDQKLTRSRASARAVRGREMRGSSRRGFSDHMEEDKPTLPTIARQGICV